MRPGAWKTSTGGRRSSSARGPGPSTLRRRPRWSSSWTWTSMSTRRATSGGYFYFAATNGFGRMLSYKSRIPERERWLIARYIKQCLLLEACPPEVVNAEVY